MSNDRSALVLKISFLLAAFLAGMVGGRPAFGLLLLFCLLALPVIAGLFAAWFFFKEKREGRGKHMKQP